VDVRSVRRARPRPRRIARTAAGIGSRPAAGRGCPPEDEERIRASSTLELLAPVVLGVVCFRRRFDGVEDPDAVDQLNRQLVSSLKASGEAVVSTTSLRGPYAIRMCMLNPTASREDVTRVLDWFESAQPSGAEDVREDQDDAEMIDPARGWLRTWRPTSRATTGPRREDVRPY
jgi:hypothetical protein